MNCPKCNFEQNPEKTVCERCGLIFAKYHAKNEAGRINDEKNKKRSDADSVDASVSFYDIFFYAKPGENSIFIFGRIVVLIFLIIWGLRFIFSPLSANYPSASFMHLVNLPFHEAGHIIFRPFGAFMTSLGGTLGQCLIPLICLFVLLLKTRDCFGASITLWWFGQNLFDIAPYVNDARSLSLPLVGGNFGYSSPYGFHDWEYLLTEMGLLRYDHVFAKSCMVVGTIVFMVSYLWGGRILYKQWKSREDT